MNKKQLAHLEKRLMEERARVMKELGYYDESFNATLQSSDGDLSSYSFHMADQGTDAMEREKQFLFASQEGRYLWHVNEALRRLYGNPDKFGHCQQCGQVNRVDHKSFERLRTQKFKACELDPSKCIDWFADQPRNKAWCTEVHADSSDSSIGFGLCRPGANPLVAIYSCEAARCESARRILSGMFKRQET